jgi:hypothetical protein
MKKILLFLIATMFVTNIFAQDEEEYVGNISKFGAAGGFTATWLMPNFDELNSKVKMLGLEEFSKSGMVTWGGAGYAYIMFWNNIRFGGMGYGGLTSTDGIINGYRTQVDYTVGMGGFTVEYTLPVVKDIAVSIGCVIGGGSAQIDIYKNKGDFTWGDVWSDIQAVNSKSEYKKITKSFFTITPTVNIDIPLNRFIAFRLGAGYQTDLSGEWKIDNEQTLFNVPSKLNANAFYVQTGLFFGFFAF